jgi:penicillin-binding protein 1B
MHIRKLFKWLIGSALTLSIIVVVAIVVAGTIIFVKTNQIVQESFAKKTFLSPTQFYSDTFELQLGQTLDEELLISRFTSQNYRQKSWGSTLQSADYSIGTGGDCTSLNSDAVKCIAFSNHQAQRLQIVASDELNKILVLIEVDPKTQAYKSVSAISLFPQLFAQYLGDSPVMQERVTLDKFPRHCIDAVLAVEDPLFLEHGGISTRGLLRAVFVNLTQRRAAQGGSTITQQLVKNQVLTSDKTIQRKIKEIVLAIVVDAQIPKDEILEAYLNIIYLGQQGNYQVRGYAAASRYYFSKDLRHLNLAECSLLAAVLNNPGRYNPFTKTENALARRRKVLSDMLEQNRILEEDFKIASEAPLPTRSTVELKETAPYFVDAVVQDLKKNFSQDLSGYKVFTTLRLEAQSLAQKAVQKNLDTLESSSKYHLEHKSHSLQGTLVSADPVTGEVVALVGGRDHRRTPYNRVLSSQRQIGSTFKPIVFLTALADTEGFTPMTPLENTPYTYKYGKQKWEPKNYDNTFSEKVPAFYALKESLNIPTARLAIQTGLPRIVSVARELGITSKLDPVPALSLGAFEATALEVLEVYTTIQRMGLKIPLKFVRKVQNEDGETLYTPEDSSPQQVLKPENFASLISIMEEGLRTGTGAGTRARGFVQTAAGKTGTTSNYKDAWFAGFTPDLVSVVWVGYDDNTPVKLSGATAALPIWTDYMKDSTRSSAQLFFNWPTEGQQKLSLSKEELVEAGVPENKAIPVDLLFYPN